MADSKWYKRLRKECRKISPHIRFKKLRYGFTRIYYKNSYLHEVYNDMPRQGYNWIFKNPRLENKQYYEEYEDNVEMIREVKNFIEGYYDSKNRIMTRMWMHRHDKEFNQNAEAAYQQMVIK